MVFSGRAGIAPAPKEINRKPQENKRNTHSRRGRCHPGKVDNKQGGDRYGDDRDERITGGAIRPLGRGRFPPENDHRGNEQHVKDKVG